MCFILGGDVVRQGGRREHRVHRTPGPRPCSVLVRPVSDPCLANWMPIALTAIEKLEGGWRDGGEGGVSRVGPALGHDSGRACQ
jgi:hypothetical protein